MSHAEDIIEGSCCALCGCYFADPGGGIFDHGYPVACYDCWEEDCGYQKAEVDTL